MRNKIERIFSYRMDDITENMNWDSFLRVKDIFDRYDIKPLIGVVPCNLDRKLKPGQKREDFWDYIRELQQEGWCIAQHGYQHTYVTKESGLLGLKEASEFAGLSMEEQYEKLKSGKEILENHGMKPEIFMAPGHTYDSNTLKALKKLGFRYVTDGYSDMPYEREGLCFIPCKSAGNPARTGVDTVCLHSNGMQEEDFRELENVIRRNRSQIVDFAELLQGTFAPYSGGAARSEKQNLKRKNWKKAVAQNELLQEYLRTHNSDNFYRKQISRVIGLPWLLLRMVFSKRR